MTVRKIINDKIYLGKYLYNSLLSNVVTSTKAIMKADSGASKTYLKEEYSHILTDIAPLFNGPEAILPDKSKIKATQKGNLQLLPSFKHEALVFPQLQSKSLLSIGQLYDEGDTAVFDDKKLRVLRNNDMIKKFLHSLKTKNVVLQGQRNLHDGLYNAPFPQLKTSYVVTKDKNKLELSQYFAWMCLFTGSLYFPKKYKKRKLYNVARNR